MNLSPGSSISSRRLSVALYLLLVLLGATGCDKVDEALNPTPKDDIAPTARAGSRQTVDEDTRAQLTGSNSYDSTENDTITFKWAQVSGPDAVLTNSTDPDPQFIAPNVGTREELQFELTVTDAAGNTDVDSAYVTVDPVASITVSQVEGNTLKYLSRAYFTVVLDTPPIRDVIIPIQSDDPAKGVAEPSSITFTEDNWDQPVTVTVTGLSEEGDDRSNYNIEVGRSQSFDPSYDDVYVNDVRMRGLYLDVELESSDFPVFKGLPIELVTHVTYTGNRPLSFSLIDPPPDVSVDFNTGEIAWIASDQLIELDEYITIEVTDGQLFSQDTVRVRATVATDLPGTITNDRITVSDTSVFLPGLSISNLTDPSTVAIQAAELPYWFDSEQTQIVSDVFSISSDSTQPIAISLPDTSLADDVDLARVRLYVQNLDPFADSSWLSLPRDPTGNQSQPSYSVQLREARFFFAVPPLQKEYEEFSGATSFAKNTRKADDKASTSVSCLPVSVPGQQLLDFDCKLSDGTSLRLLEFGKKPSSRIWTKLRFRGSSAVEVASYFDHAYKELISRGYSGLSSSSPFEVHISNDYCSVPNPNPACGPVNKQSDGSVYAGESRIFVRRNPRGLYKSLSKGLQSMIAHELHHMAHYSSTNIGFCLDDPLNPIRSEHWCDPINLWFIESSSVWFEDILYDDLNLYTKRFKSGLDRILEFGLLTSGEPKLELNDVYERFAVLMQMDRYCNKQQFNPIKLPVIGKKNAELDIASFLNDMEFCHVEEIPGFSSSSGIERLLHRYNHDTMVERKMNLLDRGNFPQNYLTDGGPRFNFQFPLPDGDRLDYNNIIKEEYIQSGSATVSLRPVLNGVFPPYSAQTVRVRGLDIDWEPGSRAYIEVSDVLSGGDLSISITSSDPDFLTEGAMSMEYGVQAYRTSEPNNMRPSLSGSATLSIDEFWVTVVNPTDTAVLASSIDLVVDNLPDSLSVQKPVSESNVSTRVTPFEAYVDTSLTPDVDVLKVEKDGLTFTIPVTDSNQFINSLITTVGENIFNLQGFNSSDLEKPLTAKHLISYSGVPSSSALLTPNALHESRVSIALRWTANGTDFDLYAFSKDPLDAIWYLCPGSCAALIPGVLDQDATTGGGPEVISLLPSNSLFYLSQKIGIDVHYFCDPFSVSPEVGCQYFGSQYSQPTSFTLSVVVNEHLPLFKRVFHYQLAYPMYYSNPIATSFLGFGSSRINDAIEINCNLLLCSVKGTNNRLDLIQ